MGSIVVALTPTAFLDVDGQVKCETFTTLSISGISEATASYIHGTSAILSFAAIAFVCIFTSGGTLKEIGNPVRQNFYKTIYNFLGAGMIVSPLISALLLLFWKETNNIIYFVELVAVWAFSAYWIVKTIEINEFQIVRKFLDYSRG